MDEAILRAFNAGAKSAPIAELAIFLSSPWMLIAVTVPLAVILIRKKNWMAIVTIALAMGASDATNARIIKPLVARDRPCKALQDVELPKKCGVGKSFASGHAAVATALVVTAGSTVPFGFAILAPLAGLVALSRIVLGQHYLSDVLAGAAIGAIIGAFFVYVRKRIERRA